MLATSQYFKKEIERERERKQNEKQCRELPGMAIISLQSKETINMKWNGKIAYAENMYQT